MEKGIRNNIKIKKKIFAEYMTDWELGMVRILRWLSKFSSLIPRKVNIMRYNK